MNQSQIYLFESEPATEAKTKQVESDESKKTSFPNLPGIPISTSFKAISRFTRSIGVLPRFRTIALYQVDRAGAAIRAAVLYPAAA